MDSIRYFPCFILLSLFFGQALAQSTVSDAPVFVSSVFNPPVFKPPAFKTPAFNSGPPEARAGILDAGNWSFSQQGSLMLQGEWRFYWQAFIAADAPPKSDTPVIRIPRTWNNYDWQGQKLPGNGYASYRLTVRLPVEHEPLALYVKSLYRAADIWVNGQHLKRIGKPGRKKADEIPRESFTVIPVTPQNASLDIVVHVSSFHHINGGINRAFELGTLASTTYKEQNRQLLASIIFGATLVLGGIFLTISLTFKRSADRVYAFGAGLSLSYGIRIMGTEKIWFLFNPGIHADWALRCEYYGLVFSQVFYLYIIRELYPQCLSRAACRLWLALACISTVLITVTPAEIYSYLRDPWIVAYFLALVSMSRAMIRAARYGLADAIPVGLIVWSSLLLLANDALIFFNLYQGMLLNELVYFLSMTGVVAVLMGRLSRSANEADKLAAALKESNLDLQQRVTERTRELADKVSELDLANQQAMHDREEAINANRKKTEFLGIMSHEVRTPLSAIQGGLQLLENEPLSDKSRLVLGNAIVSSSSLLSIVNNMLDITKIEDDHFQLQKSDFCFNAWINQLVGMVRIPVEAKGVDFITEFHGDIFTGEHAFVHGDGNCLRQVLTNLLSNATKFTHKGSIVLKITQQKKTPGNYDFLFEVIDTGIGISQSQQHRIFDRFFQVDTSFTREHSGTGLGLSISQDLVAAMGGEIGVQSQSGKGSRFFFSLTLSAAEKAQALPDQLETAAAEQKIAFRHILIVEDDKANRDLLTILVEQSGHKVTEAYTGLEAIHLCQQYTFDAVLMDIRLPEMDGVTACQTIREINTYYQYLPVIAVTANTNEKDIQSYLAGGFNRVMSKPVSARSLRLLFQEIFEHQTVHTDGVSEHLFLPGELPETEMLDRDNLSTLLHSLGPDLLREQLLKLQQGHAELIVQLTTALNCGDLIELKQVAHKLKGNSAYQGKNSVAFLCDKVEYLSENTSIEERGTLVEKIKQESLVAHKMLADWIRSNTEPDIRSESQQP